MKRVRGIVVDVHRGETYPGEVQIKGGRIQRIVRGHGGGNYLLPGLIDSYVQLQCSMLIPSRFSHLTLPHGTTSVVVDPRGIAEVLGLPGLLWMIDESLATPQKVFFIAPTGGSQDERETLTPEELGEFLAHPQVIGGHTQEGGPGEVNSRGVFKDGLCTPCPSAPELLGGHMDRLLREAVGEGIDPLQAVEMASRIPAERFNLPVGLLRPGDPADIVVVRDLKEFRVEAVFVDGKVVARGGEALFDMPPYLPVNNFHASLPPLREYLPVVGPAEVKAIRVNPDNLHTEEVWVHVKEGERLPDPSRDLIIAVCVDRYGTGGHSTSVIRGTGLKRGAVALSSPRSVIAIGAEVEEVEVALRRVVEMRGGIAVARGGEVLSLKLDVAGIMCGEEPHQVAERVMEMENQLVEEGIMLPSPLRQLKELSLKGLPRLKLTPQRHFGARRGAYVSARVRSQ